MSDIPTSNDLDAAPKGGSWVLGFDPKREGYGDVAWIAMTFGDMGWMDNDGNAFDPTRWAALPDPQPPLTGWQPAEGIIHIDEITGEGWTSNGKPIDVPWRWSVFILKADGAYDEYREGWHYRTYEEAERRAGEWQRQFGLPIEVKFLDPKVVFFRPVGALQ